jgi:hypothetical protein
LRFIVFFQWIDYRAGDRPHQAREIIADSE